MAVVLGKSECHQEIRNRKEGDVAAVKEWNERPVDREEDKKQN